MGVELEYSFADFSDRENVLEFRRDTQHLDDLFYAKSDSSIDDYGAEFVSHPCTLAFWQKAFMRDAMSKLFTEVKNNDGKVGTSCGYHIHISRKGMTRTHLIRFCLFFAMNKELVGAISRRPTTTSYAILKEYDKYRSLYDYSVTGSSKYVCVNTKPDHTIEVRCFKGTYNSVNFYSALEFVHSVYMFTKHHSSVTMCTNKRYLVRDYIYFLQSDKRYKTLYKNIADNCGDLLYWAVSAPIIPKPTVLFSKEQASLIPPDTTNYNNPNDPNNFYAPVNNNTNNITNIDGE